MRLSLFLRLTLFSACSPSLILGPSCYSPDLLLQSVSAPVLPPDTFRGSHYAYVFVIII